MSWRLMAYRTQIITLYIVSYLVLVNAECSKDELTFKEASYATKDFAIINREKEIALCVVPSKFDTCNIKWYKDGNLVAPDDNVFFLNHGQLLWIVKVQTSDAGNYSCTVFSKDQQISRSLELETYVDYDGTPFNAQSPSCQFAETVVGADYVSATCKFEIVTKPDEVVCGWLKQNTSAPKGSEDEWLYLWNIFNDSKYDDIHCRENPDLPVCGQGKFPPNTSSVFLCLTLYDITKEDFGNYLMKVNNGKQANYTLVLKEKEIVPKVDYGLVVVIAICIAGFIAVAVIIWCIVKVDVQLFLKDRVSKKPVNDGKRYDAYVSHTDNDTQFVLCLKQQLEKKGYRVYVPVIDTTPGECTLEQIAKALDESRRFIMVLSPNYIGTNFAAYEVTNFVERMSCYKSQIISIVFKNSQVDAENCRAILKHVLNISRVIRWPELAYDQLVNTEPRLAVLTDSYTNLEQQTVNSKSMEKTFKSKVYKELLLGMPPKPKANISEQNGHATDFGDSYRMNGDHLGNI